MTRAIRFVSLVAVCTGLVSPAFGQVRKGKREPIDPAGVARLVSESGAQVTVSDATGAARFVRLAPSRKAGSLLKDSPALRAASPEAKAAEFFRSHGSVFGITSHDAELRTDSVKRDRAGWTHILHRQVYRGVPVFAGELRSHLDRSGQLVAVNGNFVPEIRLDTNPRRSAKDAGRVALARVEADMERSGLSARSTTLMVFREGLAKGVPGPNRLAWQVEVGDGAGVREFVYIDAHNGKFIDQITGVHDGMFRRAYDGQNLNGIPATYPGTPFWSEGDPFPTGVGEADNMIEASKDTYDLFNNAFGRDSFDGAGAIMDSIFNRGYSCPNASWNGTFISFCPGMTSDDVTGHEWGHAYTQYTHGLIYAWQPGALNESYSDIFGEVVDLLNGRGGDAPDVPRGDECSVYGGTPPPVLTITGGSAAGTYLSRASVNEPARPFTVGPTDMALAVPAGACTAVSGVAGKIAIIDWTLTPSGGNECGSGTRAANALAAGATGIIFVAPPAGILNLGSLATIASVQVTNADGATIKAGLPAQATITMGVGTENSVRWLMGEDDTAVGLSGPLRDMWNPRCFGNPGKVSDTFEYVCSTSDNGGVHTNSGIPNRAFSLLVDGGSYNGQNVTAIGITKATHIYFRAMDVYQHPASDFPDHADSIEQSCSDLVGVDLADLSTGAPSGQVLTVSDCAQVAAAAAAVELRTPPTQCGFQPILAPNPPDRCEAGTSQATIFSDDFESDPIGAWTATHTASTADFTPRDWTWTSALPDGRAGSAVFGIDPTGGTCAPGGDESGVLHLVSPSISLPAGASNPLLTFDHWVATEGGWDGGNLKISVNGGPWQVVGAADYTYNPYNSTLFTAPQGNTNPMAGEAAFTGTDGGSVDGSWGRSHVDLTNYALPGDSIQLRYDIGTDGCGGNTGWYVDDPTVYACAPSDAPTISVGDVQVIEGDSGFTQASFKVSLSHASAKSVSSWYVTKFGSALPILDFLPALSKVEFDPLQLEADVSVKVRGERLYEKDETFFLKLFKPRHATILDGSGKATILNDDTKHRH